MRRSRWYDLRSIKTLSDLEIYISGSDKRAELFWGRLDRKGGEI